MLSEGVTTGALAPTRSQRAAQRNGTSNVVDDEASGGVLDVTFAIDEPDAADDLGEPGWPVQAAPALLRAPAQPEDHRQRGLS